MQYVRNLPWYAQSAEIPKEWKFFGFATVAPLWIGGFAVHALGDDGPQSGMPPGEESLESGADLSRSIMGYTLHYASIVVGIQTAFHWGMQAINFGLPTHTIEFTPLYRFMRFGLPIVPLTVAVLASRLSVDNPRASSVVLMCIAAASTGADFFSYAFASSPVWFPRFQWYMAISLMGGLFFLMLSERMKLKGESAAHISDSVGGSAAQKNGRLIEAEQEYKIGIDS
jgi:hypothetical protein